VRAWRVREWRAQRAERTALVGRDAELRQFDTLCAECIARRRGALVVVRGEAGIGKTRLLEEFGSAASAAGFAVHSTLMLDFGAGRALDPIARLICSILGAASALGSSARQAVLDGARRAALLREDETMWAVDLLDLPVPAALRPVYDAIDGATRQRRRSELAATLVQRASALQPLLLQIEDVHWGSAAALDTLAAVTQSIHDHRVVLVLTTRLQGDPTTGAWRESVDPRLPALTLELQPLPETLARTLGHSLGVLDDAVLETCVRRAGGNPLFLEQLLRNAAAGDGESVPGSIQSIVLARLDRLQARDRRALQAASVLGQFFSLPVLQHLLADPGYRCDALLAERLVRELGDEYLFAHALVWEGTYVSLLTEQKREWHARAADWFAQRDPMLTAEHLERAQSGQAARAYLDAGRVELAAHRHDRALRAFECGLALTEDATERATLLTEFAQLLLTTGRPHDALAAYERLLELADGAAPRARARLGVAHALRLLDRSGEALAALDQAQDEADAVLEQADRARLHYLRGSLFFPLGQVQAGLHEQTRALEHARAAGSIELQLRALSGLGDAHYAGGKVMSAYRCFRECVELSHAQNIVQVEAVNLPMLAICEYFAARMDEGLRHARSGLQLAQRVGNPRAELIARHSICMLSLEIADPVLAIDHARASVEIARSIGARRFVPEGMMFIANCLSWEGRRAEARALMLEALELAREQITYCGPWILGALAAHAQDDTERRAWLREGEEVLKAGVPAHNYIGFYSEAIQASLDTAAWEQALHYCDLLQAFFRPEPAPLADFTAERGRALARLGQGSRDPALREEVLRLIEQGQQARLRVSVAALQAAARREGWTAAGA
jgi:tetratricopeptide (TPR) repeat protein